MSRFCFKSENLDTARTIPDAIACRSGQIESARNPHCREPDRNDASETEHNNDDCTKFVGHLSASLSEVSAWDASQECAAIHSRARFSEVNLPNKRTEPFGSVICTRH